MFTLLIISGDVERLPGTQIMEHFSNTRRIKIVHQNIRRLLTNIGSLTPLLNICKNIDIVTLSETHITYNSWNYNFDLYFMPGFTFISKCYENVEGGGVGEKLKWKRREDLEDVKIESIWTEVFQTKASSIIVRTV